MDIIYEASGNGSIVLRNEEHTIWKYFNLQELPEHIAYKHREAINDWFATL